jgi:alkanesulfonate monooxygenase SsuD/methylene tetrahydromethanopterin reductase-like flavin-dependent oxidoreductase (luciferase family)
MIAVAAEFAEVIFCAPLTLEAAQKFYVTLKGKLAAYGRTPDEMKILPGLSCVIGRTDAEAEENYEQLNSLIHPIVAREILSMVLGNVDLSPYPFDGPLPENLPRSNASLQIFEQVTSMARREKLSIRQVATRVAGARAKAVIRGSPQTIADIMEEWFREDACDGFNIMPPFLPGGLDDFVEMVIPELRRRGLFRSEYEGKTLRENLGLKRPESRHAELPRPRAASGGWL